MMNSKYLKITIIIFSIAISIQQVNSQSVLTDTVLLDFVKKYDIDTTKGYYFSNIYPQPYGMVTTIYFNLPKPTTVNIPLYDAYGERISTILDSLLDKGYYEVKWNDFKINISGIYYYKIITEDTTITRKILLVR